MPRRTASKKLLRDKTFNIAKPPKYDGYQRGLASIIYKFFNKKIAGGAAQNKNISNEQLAEELHKLIIRKFKKVYSSLKDNIWGANLVDR